MRHADRVKLLLAITLLFGTVQLAGAGAASAPGVAQVRALSATETLIEVERPAGRYVPYGAEATLTGTLYFVDDEEEEPAEDESADATDDESAGSDEAADDENYDYDYASALGTYLDEYDTDGDAESTDADEVDEDAEESLAGDRTDLEIIALASTDGKKWRKLTTLTTDEDGAFELKVSPSLKTWYRFKHPGEGDRSAACTSDAISLTPRSRISRPSAPATVTAGSSVTFAGSVLPKGAAKSRVVRVKLYRWEDGRWTWEKTLKAKTWSAKGATKYRVKASMDRAGRWKAVATVAAAGRYGPGTSSARAFSVVAK